MFQNLTAELGRTNYIFLLLFFFLLTPQSAMKDEPVFLHHRELASVRWESRRVVDTGCSFPSSLLLHSGCCPAITDNGSQSPSSSYLIRCVCNDRSRILAIFFFFWLDNSKARHLQNESLRANFHTDTNIFSVAGRPWHRCQQSFPSFFFQSVCIACSLHNTTMTVYTVFPVSS